MKIYIAGQFESRKRLRPVAHAMWEMDIQVVSSWLDETSKPAHMGNAEFMRKLGEKDRSEIQSADILIQDTFKMSSRGGASTEFGLALQGYQTKSCWVVGPQRSVFHFMADKHFKSWKACLAYLRTLKSQNTV